MNNNKFKKQQPEEPSQGFLDGQLIQSLLRKANGSQEDINNIHNLYKRYIAATAPAPVINCGSCPMSVSGYFNDIKNYYFNNLDKFK